MKTAEETLKKHLKTESLTEKQYNAILKAMKEFADFKVDQYVNETLNAMDFLAKITKP